MVVPAARHPGYAPGLGSCLLLSLALTVAFTLLLIWLAARIYERVVLRMGAPLKLGEALRLIREPDPR